MLYIIGIGLNERGISKEGMLAIDKCAKVYLENYTVDFPYDLNELRLGKKKPVLLSREDVESDKLIKGARGRRIALLVYGSPLFATTHMSLILDAQKEKVNVKVIHSASIFDAIAETGLQLYKFGKIASMPNSSKDKDESEFLKYVRENQSIKAHSLILVDIGMSFEKALTKLEKSNVKIDKIVVCSQMGNEESQIFYGKINDLKDKKIQAPFCFIIPSELHFLEKEGLSRFG